MRLRCNLQCEQTERWESVVNIKRDGRVSTSLNRIIVNAICCLYERIKRIFACGNTDKHVTLGLCLSGSDYGWVSWHFLFLSAIIISADLLRLRVKLLAFAHFSMLSNTRVNITSWYNEVYIIGVLGQRISCCDWREIGCSH